MANRKDDDQEMSMEEILASIRKYVTEDDPNAQKPQESTSSSSVDHPAVHEEEEILDLSNLQPAAYQSQTTPHQAANQLSEKPHDSYQTNVNDQHDTHFLAPNNGHMDKTVDQPHVSQPLAQETSQYHQEAHIAPLPSTSSISTVESTPQSHTLPQNAMTEPHSSRNEDDMTQPSFASSETKSATTSSLSKLMEKTKSLQQQAELALSPMISGGHTIESLAIHAMTPYIKEWLDANLPTLVERLVQNEIEKMTHELLQK